jgi:hypothetical protein
MQLALRRAAARIELPEVLRVENGPASSHALSCRPDISRFFRLANPK